MGNHPPVQGLRQQRLDFFAQRHQLKGMERLGDLYRDQELVFTTEVGTPINHISLRKRSFAPLL